ncbi:MAG: shikimate dehydrogenase [Chloroflexi bacterium]|nr:shikimate dehydrogenase [Chloroflexota bacterium]
MNLALLGHPLSHSLSPAMHNAALAHVGLHDWRYEAMPVEPARLAEAVAIIRGDEYAGANVTVPYKEAVIPFLDGLTLVAEAIGAVNTIVKRVGAIHELPLQESPLQLIGHNTDAAGLLADLYTLDVHVSNRPVLILGAGGAARAAVAALAPLGCEIRLAARRREQAQPLITNNQLPITIYDLTINDLQRASRNVALILNCTPLGMSPNVNASPWFESVPFPPGAFVYDLVYNPADTLLTRQARDAGLRATTGLGMLVEQGALAFEQWTGKPAPRQLMRQAAEQKLRIA